MCFLAAALRRLCQENPPISAFVADLGDDKEKLPFLSHIPKNTLSTFSCPFPTSVRNAAPPDGTQAELGQQAGLSVRSIRMLERGEGSIASARPVMAALGLTWAWPEPVTEEPGDALARLRHGAGLSQRATARAIGTTQTTIVAMQKRFIGTLPWLAAYLRRVGRPDVLRAPGALQRRLVPKSNAPEISEGRDFFGWSQKVDWIVTNPPYSKLGSFLVHAMALADNTVFLTSLKHLNTRARIRDIREAGFGTRRVVLVPLPEGWPHSGFQFAAVHLQRGWRRGCMFQELREGPLSSSIT
jgi:DNA-binding XRE family transcriptional regulator